MMLKFMIDVAIVVLACVGLWVTVDKAAAGFKRAWAWLVRDRVGPLLEDESGCDCCEFGCHYGTDPACGRCGHPVGWHVDDDEELPPERSWEELTTPAPGVVAMEYLAALRERRAPKWEAEARGHYMAMGLDYPSGLVARVRELTP